MKNDTAQISSGQMKELSAAIIEGIPTDLPSVVAKNWIGKKRELHRRMKVLLLDEEVAEESDLLQTTASVSVGVTERFVAKDHLKTANIGYTGNNFDKLFLKKVEENVEGVTVAIHRLEKNSPDAPILAELGNRAEISLPHLFQLIEKQSKGEDGVLLTNGYANIAYVIGNDGNLWVVSARWRPDRGDWAVLAVSVGPPGGWTDGSRVLSRDS